MAALELRRFLRDRSNLFFVFVLPLVLVLLVGVQFGGEGSSRVVVSGPPSALRDELVAALEDVDVEVDLASAGAGRDRVARGRADAAVVVPGGGGADGARIEVVVGNQASSTVAQQRVGTAVRRVDTARAQRAALVDAGVDAGRVDVALAAAADATSAPGVVVDDGDELGEELEGLGRFDLGAGQQLLLFVFLTSLTGATTLIQSRTRGVLPRVLASPVSTGQVVAGQVVGRVAIAATQAAYLVIGTAVLFGVDWGSIGLTMAVTLVFCVVAAAVAMVIGAVVDSENTAVGVGIGVGLVTAALGGSMLPLELFPDPLRTVSRLTPHAWGYEAFADIQRHGGTLVDVLPSLGVLAAMAAVLLALGSVLLRRSLARAV